MKKKGRIVVLSGFSGAGKGTIKKALMKKYNYVESISWTTRKPRDGEKDGEDYYFHTQEEFDQMIANDGFAEYARYVEKSYGSPRKFIEEHIALGVDVILEIEMQGAMQVYQNYPDARLIFVTAPTGYQLEKQLSGRGTEDAKKVHKRLCQAIEEAKGVENYQAIVVNCIVEESVEEVHELIQCEQLPPLSQEKKQVILQVEKELKEICKIK